MLARLRPFLLNTPVLVLLGLAAAWLLFGWFGFGPVAKWGAERFVADKAGHRLVLDEPKFDPLRLSLTVTNLKLTEPDGKPLAGFKELFVDFEASSLFRWAWTFDSIRLTGPEGRLDLLPGGKINWSTLLEALKDEEEDIDRGLPRLLIRHFQLEQGRFDFADRTVAPIFEMGLTPLELTLDDLSTLPDDKGAYQISARTLLGGELRWQGEIGLKPLGVTGAFSLTGLQLGQLAPYLKGRLMIAAPEGAMGFASHYRLTYDKSRLSLNLDRIDATLDGVRLRGGDATEAALVLNRLAIRGGRFDLEQRRLDLAEIALSGGQVNLIRRADGRLDVQDWFPPAVAPVPEPPRPAWTRPTAEKPPGSVRPWRIDLARLRLDGVGVHVLDHGFARPLALDVANLKVDFKADARFGAGAPQATLATGAARLDKIGLSSAGKPVLAVGAVVLEDIGASLAERHAQVGRLTLAGGRLTAVRGADGRIALLDALTPAGKSSTPAGKRSTPTPVKNNEPGWTWRLNRAEMNDFQAVLRDEALKPAAGLTLSDIDASLDGLTQDLAAAVPMRLNLRAAQGGSLKMQGKLVPAKGWLDARVDLAGLSLTPAQPYIDRAANVVLVSGRVASQGRLKLAEGISYRGGFSVADLLVNEAGTGNRVLAWKDLASDELAASPEAVTLGEVKVDGLGLKLVIYKDKSLNLTQLLKPGPAAPADPPAVMAAAKGSGKPARPGLKFAVERVSVRAGVMDFADESLALPFGARIHDLKGAIDGIGLEPGRPAQLEFDGLVDDYGLARAVGRIDLIDPAGFTDIKAIFRNVEMNRLTPYSATFAGRKIDSGKLSLDLEYKVAQRQLQGENKVVMDKLVLGERVESPTAKDLPLDLAIAILEDADGVIELGLPVSGSLDDPQFSYGAIVWKAITSVIGKIVLAPFRALGKLFGIGGEKLEQVNFDVGEAKLLPPQRDTLRQLAQALAKRPNLALTATPVWNPVTDRRAIKEARLRRALAEAMGRPLGADEDPGPVSTAQPKTRDGLEKLYAAGFGAEALKTLKAKFAQANPEPAPTGTGGKLLSRLSGLLKTEPEPLSEAEAARLQGADLHGLMYRALLDREVVPDEGLHALAQERGAAILREMQANGVAAERLTLKPAEPAAGEGAEVVVKLGLAVARKSEAR